MSAPATGEARDGFVNLDGLRFHWLEWGERDAPPLVLLHGGRSSARGTWGRTAPGFASDYHVCAPDHRGHGESSWDPEARYTHGTFLRDFERLVGHLGLERFRLIGHSMGAIIALAFAAAHPAAVERLVLIDWAPPPARPGPADAEHAVDPTPVIFASRDEAEAYARQRYPEAVRDRPLDYGLIDLPDGRVTWRADVAGIARAWRSGDRRLFEAGWAEVAALRAPTLLLRAGRSRLADPESCARMSRMNPLVQVREYPDAGHWLHQDRPEQFKADVTAFFGAPNRT